MANINLGKYYKKSTDVSSPVDSRIVLNKIETDEKYYGDIKLDLSFDELKDRALNANISNRDLQMIYNEESILTSLKNIFKTYRGSRLLNPEMEFDLSQYLFEPLTQSKAYFLGYDLMMMIPKYEPRVAVSSINVIAYPEDSCYVIELSIFIPQFSKNVDLKCIFDESSFSIMR